MNHTTEWQWLSEQSMPGVFKDLDSVFSLSGQLITQDRLSELLKVSVMGENYYVKRYYLAGKNLRRYLGEPRVKSEWINLQWFAQHGIATAEVVACGMERRLLGFKRGALITREIPGAVDLASLARSHDPRLSNERWVNQISLQAAEMLYKMHQHGFIHNDFKWRNLLVDSSDKLYVIDCPLGRFWYGPFLRYRILKELAMLDRVAKYRFRRTQRLRFFLNYRRARRLTPQDKKLLYRFFQRKERRPSSFAIQRTVNQP